MTEMTEEKRQRTFKRINYLFSLKTPVLPNDFRMLGITSLDDARELMQTFNESEQKKGCRWIIEERQYECQVIDPEDGKTKPGSVTGFFGQLDWAYRGTK